jgi:hypothetical protein
MPLRRPNTSLVIALLAGVLLGACEPETRITDAAFELHTSMGCELGAADSVELAALGDFPTQRERFSLDAPTSTFENFPLATRELGLSGVFAGALATGRAALLASDGELPHSMIVLPEARSCPLSDRGIAAGAGAVVAALPDGGMLIAGGTASDGKVLKSAVSVGPGELIGEDVPDGMFLRRRYATATRVGTRVVVAGGAEGPGGSAEETYEVYDSVLGIFARELSDQLLGARMEHGAALLPDGSILLAGGRSEPGGAPLATAELVRLVPPAPDQPGDLVVARVAPNVLVLDSGAVIVAGGRDAAGALVASLERFEAAAKRFVRIVLDLPSYENAVAVALPGARVAWVGCDAHSPRCGVTLILLHGAEPVQVDLPLDWASAAPLGLSAVRAIALDDGRMLITGRDPDANMMSRALLVDLDAQQIESVEASRAPNVLVSLADGSVAELDPFGTSLRRLGSFSVYDSPSGDVLTVEARRAVLDAAPRWNRSDEGLRALVSGARIDVPHLRFGNFRCELRFDGDALIQIATSDAPALAIGVGARVSAPGCSGPSASGRVVLERRPGSIGLRVGSSGRDGCSVTFPSTSPARIAIEATVDTVIRSLEITRL